MAKTNKQFGYKIIKMTKSDQMPFNPIIILNLDHCTGGNNDMPQISSRLNVGRRKRLPG